MKARSARCGSAEVPVSVLQDKALCREIKRRFPLTNPVLHYDYNLITIHGESLLRIHRRGNVRSLCRLVGDWSFVGSFAGPGWKARLFGALRAVLA